MDYQQVQLKTNTESELNKSDKNISLTPIVSCLDDNLNYTYAKSCKGGKYLFYLG